MLEQVYDEYRKAASPELLAVADTFSPPLLVGTSVDWSDALNRVAVVGQESAGWDWSPETTRDLGYDWHGGAYHSLRDFFVEPEAVRDLQRAYDLFDFAAQEPVAHRSPFWRAFRHIGSRFNQGERSHAMAWTNLIRSASYVTENDFTLWNRSATDSAALLRWQSGLLRRELRALSPTLILFVSGPYYDRYIKEEFPDAQWEALPGHREHAAARLSGASLPAPAYRTYHPGYLNRQPAGFAPLDAAISDARDQRR